MKIIIIEHKIQTQAHSYTRRATNINYPRPHYNYMTPPCIYAPCCSSMHHLHCTASQSKGHRPQRPLRVWVVEIVVLLCVELVQCYNLHVHKACVSCKRVSGQLTHLLKMTSPRKEAIMILDPQEY